MRGMSGQYQRRVVVVGGPSGGGKSALALALAERLDGVVINADAMQVYRELRILTARPTPADEARAPHRLYGVLPAAEACSAARWRAMALVEIAAAGDRTPIVVGGTGLYLGALMTGLAPVPEIPRRVRAAARARHRTLGGARLHAELAGRDRDMAARLDPGDGQRLMRAWEVVEATGRSLAAWQAEAEGPPANLSFQPILVAPPRAALYAACDARFCAMIEAGAVEEVRALEALGLAADQPAMKALGVPELGRYIAGEIALASAVAQAQQATRHYAKRQLTWFRRQPPWVEAGGDAGPLLVTEQLSEKNLTNLVTKLTM